MATVGLRVGLLFLLFLAVSAKKVDSGTQTEPPKKIFEFSSLTIQDLLRCGAVMVGVIAVGLSDKRGEIRNWQTFDAFLNTVEGLAMFFFPQQMLAYLMDGKVDHFHVYLTQLFGAMELGAGFTTFAQLQTNSKDSLVRYSWLLSRLFAGTVIVSTQIRSHLVDYQGSQRLTDQHFALIAAIPVYLMFTLYHLMRYRGNGRRRSADASGLLQTCLLIFILIGFNASLSQVATPELILKFTTVLDKPDAMHLHLIRLLGSFFLALVIQMIFALQYDNDEDRKSHLGGILVIALLLLPLIGLYQWKEPIYNSKGTYFAVGCAALYTILAVCGLNNWNPCACLCGGKKTK